MKRLLSILLVVVVLQHCPAPAYAYTDDNPFVEAMLRMMEVFGLIDRTRLPLGAPYLPSYGQPLAPGLGGVGGLGGLQPGAVLAPGALGFPGMSPMTSFGGIPGVGGYPGAYGMPGAMGLPNTYPPAVGNWANGAWQGYGHGAVINTYLNGIWELHNGGVVIIDGNNARLYLTRDKYQDFRIAYDQRTLTWAPLRGGSSSSYRYQMRDKRMVLQDDEGNYLLLRRRR